MDAQRFMHEISWPALFGLVGGGFCAMYFGLALGTLALTRYVFPALGVGRVVDLRPLQRGQIGREIGGSLVACAIFGGYGIVTVAIERAGLVSVIWQADAARVAMDLVVLTLWNDLHFYACHRLLHTRWLYRHVHRTHHRSLVPTPFATYSFHWFESALLGSVMVLAMPLRDFSAVSLVFFPLVSLVLNCVGHMNYEIFPRAALENPLAATSRHSLHHTRVDGNYGFMLPVLDRVLGTALRRGPTD